MSREIALLVNPASGRGRGTTAATTARLRLHKAGFTVREAIGWDALSALDQARAMVRSSRCEALVVVGGDGMVSHGLQLVAGTGLPLGVIPAGTGNDFARDLGIPTDPRGAADVVVDTLASGWHPTVDLGRCGDRWFATVVASGFGSRVTDRTNRMTWPAGRARHNLAMLAELRVFEPIPYVIEFDGVRLETEAMLVAVGNSTFSGGGMRICPEARLDDGLLDIVVIGRISKTELLRTFPRVYRGTHARHPRVTTYRARRVTLAAPDVTAYADGEPMGALPVVCEAVPDALRVLAPQA